jgi:hypothetical protein
MPFQSLTEAAAAQDAKTDDPVEKALALLGEQVKGVQKEERADFLTAVIVVSISMLRQIEEPGFVRGFLHRAVIDLNRPRHTQFDFLE